MFINMYLMKQLILEAVAIRAIIEIDETPRPGSTAELDAMTREILAAFRPRPIANTRPSNVVQLRRVRTR